MNLLKALVVVVLGISVVIFLAVAVIGVVATAAVTTAAVAISESGVVQAFEEVADGAERVQIEVDEGSISFTNPDSGESRVVITETGLRGSRLELNVPEIAVTDGLGERRVIVPGLRGRGEVSVPEITITDPDSGQSRVLIPDTVRHDVDVRVPRVVWDGDYEWHYGPEAGLRVVGGIFRGLFNLAALVLIVAGVYLLIRNRRRDEVDQVEKSA